MRTACSSRRRSSSCRARRRSRARCSAPCCTSCATIRERLDALVDEINGLGYGLTLGVHTRIDSTAKAIAQRARVGNVYVNRNMIGAVVGVQPFGGMGLSGTGPKAGGPHYLPRFATERTVTTNTAAVGGNATLLSLDAGPGALKPADFGAGAARSRTPSKTVQPARGSLRRTREFARVGDLARRLLCKTAGRVGRGCHLNRIPPNDFTAPRPLLPTNLFPPLVRRSVTRLR